MIEIYTEELPAGWEWQPDNYLGGTPEFYVNTAECALEFDDVFVYYDGKPCEHNGVYYMPRSSFKGGDVVLSCNSKAPLVGKHSIYWSNWYGKRDKDDLEFDERIVQSPYHQSVYGSNSRIVPASCNSNDYSNPVKTKGQCLYSSSPDRGGEFISGIWRDVKKEVPWANLVTTYDKRISEKEMIKLYKSSEFWLHPGQGIELFCISAVKAQVAMCIPVVVPNMALETTVKYGVKTTIDKYKKELIKAIRNPIKTKDVMFDSWKDVTKDLFREII